MHFRLRGNNLQIVKTVVDPETRKTISKPVGSANLLRGAQHLLAQAASVRQLVRWL